MNTITAQARIAEHTAAMRTEVANRLHIAEAALALGDTTAASEQLAAVRSIQATRLYRRTVMGIAA